MESESSMAIVMGESLLGVISVNGVVENEPFGLISPFRQHFHSGSGDRRPIGPQPCCRPSGFPVYIQVPLIIAVLTQEGFELVCFFSNITRSPQKLCSG